MNKVSKPAYALIGLVLLGALLLSVIAFGSTVLRGLRLDLTENNLYTLSSGTRQILQTIDEPLDLYFFYTPETARDLAGIDLYARRVQDMLRRMERIAGGKLNLAVVHPEPFSREEDRAVQLGIQQVPIGGGENLYFGLAATNALGETRAIPFFSDERQDFLEYDLAELIHQLNQTKKPTVGLMTSLEMAGSAETSPMSLLQSGSSGQPAWQILERIRQFFDVQILDSSLKRIPEKIDLLWLVHPIGLTSETRYAIDQFVLSGGKALIFLDPYSLSAQLAGIDAQTRSTTPTHSNLKDLLAAWGLRMRESEFVADAGYAMQVRYDPSAPPAYDYSLLGVPSEGLNQNDIITRGLDTVNIDSGGILKPIKGATTEFIPLIESSDKAMPMPADRLRPSMNPTMLQRGFEPTGETYALAARVSGPAATAFADGPPGAKKDGATQTSQSHLAEAHLTESQGPINVVVFADADLLTDRLWVQFENFLGRQIARPWSDNANLVANAVDHLLGSNALISIRGQSDYWRPFERVDELRREANQRFLAKEQELQQRLAETERKLAELQNQRGENSTTILMSPEQREAIEGFRRDQVEIREELRAVRHRLDEDIEQLGTTLKFINILLIPLLLVVGVLGYRLLRRARPSTLAEVKTGGRA